MQSNGRNVLDTPIRVGSRVHIGTPSGQMGTVTSIHGDTITVNTAHGETFGYPANSVFPARIRRFPEFKTILSDVCATYGVDPKTVTVKFMYRREKLVITDTMDPSNNEWSGPEDGPFVTVCECHLMDHAAQLEYVGQSVCHPSDQFQKRIGRNLSFKRAWAAFKDDNNLTKLPQNVRKAVQA